MWKIQYTQKSAKFLSKLNSDIKERLRKGIEELGLNPDLGKQLAGPLKGSSSLRIGDYRVIYKKEIDTLVILIVAIGHRKEIYR